MNGRCAVSKKPVGTTSILVVDDHDAIADLMAAMLQYEGFDVDVARSSRAGLKLANVRPFDLVILDFGLANVGGHRFGFSIRASGVDVPLLYIVSRDDARGHLAEASIGSEDCLLRPFSMMELVARVKSIVYRQCGDDFRLRFADLTINEDSHQVWRAGTPVSLSETEFDLLRLFLLNPRQVLTKNRIIDHAWRYNFVGSRDIVETYVFYLRKKLDACGPPLIHTIRHVGYVLREAS
jgi:two-component system OmpR family response regulator